MTTFPLNTMLRGTKAAFLAFTLVIASFGAGCEGAEGFEGDEEGMEQVGETEQALSGKIGLNPTQMKQKCEAAGHVYDPSTNGCSQTCAPGLVPSSKNSFKCISALDNCVQNAKTPAQLTECGACHPKYEGDRKCPVTVSENACLAAGNYWSQAGKTCHTKGSIGHYDALCKHNGMEYDSSKAGQTFPCKVSTKNPAPGTQTSPNTNCMSDPDCMVVLCNFPGNGAMSVCGGG